MFQDKNRRALRVLLAVSLLVCAFGPSAQAITFWGADYGITDIVAEPNNTMTWDQATITFKMDTAFMAVWSDPIHHAFVRDTFSQWGTAATRDYGTVNSHYALMPSALWDLGSIALHELGHGLGIHHPFDGADVNRNYHFADWEVPTPYDGTQTWVPEDDTLGEVMGYGLLGGAGMLPGTVNRTLSWDELNGARYLYGGYGPRINPGLNFVEVGPTEVADIVVTAADLPAGVLAWAGPTALTYPTGDPVDGGITGGAQITFNTDFAADIGYVPSVWAAGWDLRLPGWSGLYPYGIQMWVDKPGGVNLVGQDSGTMGDHYLQSFAADETGSPAVYTWTRPSNLHPLVGPTIVNLEFDAPATPIIAFTTDAEGNILLPLPATSAVEFRHTGLEDDDIGPWLRSGGSYAVVPEVLEEGIVLRGSENAPSEVTRIGLLNVSGMGLCRGDLNDDLLEWEGIDYLCLPCMGDDILLGADGVEHVLLFTDGTNITPEMIADPGFEFYHVPDGEDYVAEDFLAYDEMVVILESEALFDGYLLTHRSYSLLGRTVTGIIPEPASLALLLAAGAGLVALRNRRSGS